MFKTLTGFDKIKCIMSIILMVTGSLFCFYALLFLPLQTVKSPILNIVFPGLGALMFAFVISASKQDSVLRYRKLYRWLLGAIGWMFAISGGLLLIEFAYLFFMAPIRDFMGIIVSIIFISIGILQIIFRSNNVMMWAFMVGCSGYFIKNISSVLSIVDTIFICGAFLFFIGILFLFPFAIRQTMNIKAVSE
jgi:hypothetical protein